MNLNPVVSRQWAKWAVLSMVLVSAPGAAWAEDAQRPGPEFNEGAPRSAEGRGPLTLRRICLTPQRGEKMSFRELDLQTYEVTLPPVDEVEKSCRPLPARIVPAFRDGVSIGFKLFSIEPGSVYEQAGLRNGDVVLSVNGGSLSSSEKALETYSKVRDAQRIEVEVEREGKRILFTYLVKRDAQR